MPQPFSTALYYPSIDIKNERWLRSAVLFWDSIRTIAPVSHRDPYSSEFARELSDEGLLNPIRVSSDMDEVEDLTDKVLEFLTDPSSVDVMLGTENCLTSRINRNKMSYELLEHFNSHPEKLSYKIRSVLERGLNEDDWIRVAPGFANFYMTLLASQLAERLGLALVTESATADQLALTVRKGKPLRATGGRHIGRQFDAFGPRRALPKDLIPSLLIDFMVQGISLPENLSVGEILKFKKYHSEELAVFRREVSRLAADVPDNLPVEALRQVVSDQYQANVLPAMHSLRESLRAQRWDTGLNGLLKVSFLSIPPTSAALLTGIPTSIALVAGVGVSLAASAVLLTSQRRRAIIDNPYSYLLSLEREL